MHLIVKCNDTAEPHQGQWLVFLVILSQQFFDLLPVWGAKILSKILVISQMLDC